MKINTNMLLAAYPVGSLYLTTNEINPGTLFGGTWEKLTGDAYLKIVTNNPGQYDGTSDQHKIPITSMPSHNHQTSFRGGNSGDGGNAAYANGKVVGQGGGWNGYQDYWMGKTGGGQPYYPYYYGIYVWRRTA